MAGEDLPQFQSGFRKGRDCVNMVFAVRQLEKTREHSDPLYSPVYRLEEGL